MLARLRNVFKENKTAVLGGVFGSVFTLLTVLASSLTLYYIKYGSFNLLLTSLTTKVNTQRKIAGTVKTDSIAEESKIVDVVDKANPAVVSIVITKDVPIIERYYQDYSPFGDNFFNDFFGNNFKFQVPQQRQNGTEKQEVGGGSGFFVSTDGFVVTNRHVVDDDKASYTVLTNDGEKHAAQVLAKDPILDIAILKVKENGFPFLSFGNSDLLKPGQTAIAIGNALAEFRNSVSVGVISGLSRSIVAGDSFGGNSEQLEGVIQTDAAINPGNSGGPLLNIKGEVIGVNVAIERDAQNIGFALPSNTIEGIVDSIKKYGEIIRPYLGVRYVQITDSLKKINNLTTDYGVLVIRGKNPDELAVIPGSPADKAGIAENDIILEIDGIKLEQKNSLSSIIRQKQIDQTVKLKILHKGIEKEITVKLEKAPRSL